MIPKRALGEAFLDDDILIEFAPSDVNVGISGRRREVYGSKNLTLASDSKRLCTTNLLKVS